MKGMAWLRARHAPRPHDSRQIAANEHQPTLARLVRLPGALMITIEHHVHTLKHKAVRIILEGENTLAAKDIRSFFGDQLLHPGKECIGVHGSIR